MTYFIKTIFTERQSICQRDEVRASTIKQETYHENKLNFIWIRLILNQNQREHNYCLCALYSTYNVTGSVSAINDHESRWGMQNRKELIYKMFVLLTGVSLHISTSLNLELVVVVVVVVYLTTLFQYLRLYSVDF
jgi:hypothetical protein